MPNAYNFSTDHSKSTQLVQVRKFYFLQLRARHFAGTRLREMSRKNVRAPAPVPPCLRFRGRPPVRNHRGGPRVTTLYLTETIM